MTAAKFQIGDTVECIALWGADDDTRYGAIGDRGVITDILQGSIFVKCTTGKNLCYVSPSRFKLIKRKDTKMAGERINLEANCICARELVLGDCDGFTTVDTIKGSDGRWQRHVTTVVRREADGKLFAMDWQEALTEYQESDYPDEIYEVEAVTEQVVVTKYVEVK